MKVQITSAMFHDELTLNQQNYLRENYADSYMHFDLDTNKLIELTKCANIPQEDKALIRQVLVFFDYPYTTREARGNLYSNLIVHTDQAHIERLRNTCPIYEVEQEELDAHK